jgi:hypothetical protein
VRSTSAAVHDVLRRTLAAHLVEPDEDPASPNFSLHVAEVDGARGAQDLHLLYRGITAVVRTRDLRRLVDGLLGYLSAAVERPDDRTLRLDLAAFVKDGVAVLAPAAVRSSMPVIERRLNAQGLRAVDRPWACVDATTAELIVPEPDLTVDGAALDCLPSNARRDAAVPAGRYPVVGWGFGIGADERGPISRALAVTLAGARLVDGAALGPKAALGGLAALIGRLQPVGLWADQPEALVNPLVALASPAGG